MKKTKLFLLAAGLLAAAPASAQDINSAFDGTLQSFGQRYVTIPRQGNEQMQAWDVPANGKLTISVRCVLNKMDDSYGMFSSRVFRCKNYEGVWGVGKWDDKTDLDGWLTLNKDFTLYGFEIFGGKNHAQKPGYGLNTSPSFNGVSGKVVLKNAMHNSIDQDKQWSYITVVIDSEAGFVDFYCDGNLIEHQTEYNGNAFKGNPIQSYYNFLIGARYYLAGDGGTHVLEGSYRYPKVNPAWIWQHELDDLRIYNKALTADEIHQDMVSGFPIYDKDNGLVLAHDFAHVSGNNFVDISGNGYNAAQNGTAFPAVNADKTVTLLPVEKDVDGTDMGTLEVQRFTNGTTADIATGYQATAGEDFRVYAQPASAEYELIGIYVNGVPQVQGSFFKANDANTTVEARFRKKAAKAIYLVGTTTDHKTNEKFRFQPVADQPGVYTIGKVDILDGRFHIVDINKDDASVVDVTYPFDMYKAGNTVDQVADTDPLYRMHKYAIHLYAMESQLYWREAYLGYQNRLAEWLANHSGKTEADYNKAADGEPKYDEYFYNRDFAMVYTSKVLDETAHRHMLKAGATTEAEALHFRVHPNGALWNGKPVNPAGIQTYAAADNKSNAIHNAQIVLYYPYNYDGVAAGEAPVNFFTVGGSDVETGVEEIATEDNSNAPVEYYNLNGIRVNGENLTPGLYIVRQGNKVVKRLVK